MLCQDTARGVVLAVFPAIQRLAQKRGVSENNIEPVGPAGLRFDPLNGMAYRGEERSEGHVGDIDQIERWRAVSRKSKFPNRVETKLTRSLRV